MKELVEKYRIDNPEEPMNPVVIGIQKGFSLEDIHERTGVSIDVLDKIKSMGPIYEPAATDLVERENLAAIREFVFGGSVRRLNHSIGKLIKGES